MSSSPGRQGQSLDLNHRASGRAEADEVPIMRISVAAWRNYFKEHRGPLVEFISKAKGVDAKTIDDNSYALLPILGDWSELSWCSELARTE